MGYPNQEVKTSFLSYLLRQLLDIRDTTIQAAYRKLHIFLNDKKIDLFIETVKSILGSILYAQIANQDKSYYHSLFYLMLSASGVDMHTEILTSRGRMDTAAEFHDKVYIIELKCNQNSDKAIRQILNKKFYEKYQPSGKALYLMGVNFDSEKRIIKDWRWGELQEFI